MALLNCYACPNCHHQWQDVYESAVDSTCPECKTRNISPFASQDALPPERKTQPRPAIQIPREGVVVRIPTYYGNTPEHTVDGGELPEWSEQTVPVLVQNMEGVRLLLGSDNEAPEDDGRHLPDIYVERRPRGWAVMIAADVGGDAGLLVYIFDDGRIYAERDHAQDDYVTLIGPTQREAMGDDVRAEIAQLPDAPEQPDGTTQSPTAET